MATDTKENNDLLILADEDIDTDNLIIEDENLNEDIIGSSNELITFDDDGTSAVEDVDFFGETKEKDDNLNLSENSEISDEGNNLDLGDFSGETIEDETVIDNINEESSFGANDLSPVLSSVGTMEDILDRAMHELDSRAEIIGKEIESEETNISDLKEQISALETQAEIAKGKVSDLNEEQNMIEKNIKSIERMKKNNITADIKSDTSNVKRK